MKVEEKDCFNMYTVIPEISLRKCSVVEVLTARTRLNEILDQLHRFILQLEILEPGCVRSFSIRHVICISHNAITKAHLKKGDLGRVHHEQHGTYEQQNKIPPEVIDNVRQHIHQIPNVGGHYARQDSNRKSLERGSNHC